MGILKKTAEKMRHRTKPYDREDVAELLKREEELHVREPIFASEIKFITKKTMWKGKPKKMKSYGKPGIFLWGSLGVQCCSKDFEGSCSKKTTVHRYNYTHCS